MDFIGFLSNSFQAGGIFMYAILFVLALGTAIGCERVLTLFFRIRVNTREQWNKISEKIKAQGMDQALEICQGIQTPIGKVWNSGLQQALSKEGSEKEIEDVVEETMLEVIPLLEKRVHYLYTLSNVATLLGLLGTVSGLIQSFGAISVSDPAEKSALLANGISLALHNTGFGLLVAIILMLSYSFIQARSARLGDELDEFSVRMVHLLAAYKRKSQSS